MAAFGNIPESKNISHLTISKGVVERIDAPTFIELYGSMELNTKIAGSNMRFHIPPTGSTANVADVMLPKAVPGMHSSVYLSSAGGLVYTEDPLGIDYQINAHSALTIKAYSGDYTVGSGLSATARVHTDKFLGIQYNDTSVAASSVAPIPISTQIKWSRPLDGSGDPTDASFSQIGWEKLSLDCYEHGLWHVSAVGTWVFSTPT